MQIGIAIHTGDADPNIISAGVPTLDSRIDEIYRAPLKDFVALRQALAKTLTGDDRKQVTALQKPLALPWLVNQTYWQARRTYDRLLAAGEKLRAAQVGALKGKSADIRGAMKHHAEVLTEAVGEATRIAESAGLTAVPDGLRRMFEAISTRESLPAPHGRFVKPIEPAGFEALAGIAIAPLSREAEGEFARGSREREVRGHNKREAHGHEKDEAAPADNRRREEQERQREEARLEAVKRRKTAIRDAETRAARAVEEERRARAAWETARRKVADADRALADLLESGD